MSNLMAPGTSGEEGPAEPKGPTHEEIAALAYEYWRDRGSRHGFDWEDWFDAESDLLEPEEEQKEGD